MSLAIMWFTGHVLMTAHLLLAGYLLAWDAPHRHSHSTTAGA